MRIVGYTYNADNYCPDCIVDVVCSSQGIEGHGLSYDTEQALDRLAISDGINRMDESTFDSGQFPKVIFSTSIEEDEFCGKCYERF